MALIQTAYLRKSDVPEHAALQLAIDQLGLNLTIDDSYRAFDCSGFLPCVLKGKKSGFEIYFGSSEEGVQAFPHLRKKIGDRDCVITFRWGGDMAECACVCIVGAALAKSFDAVVHYEPDDMLYSSDGLLQEAEAAMKELG